MSLTPQDCHDVPKVLQQALRTWEVAGGVSSREEKPRDLQTSCLCMHCCLHCQVWRRLGAQCKHLGHTRHPQGPCPAGLGHTHPHAFGHPPCPSGLGQPLGLPMQKLQKYQRLNCRGLTSSLFSFKTQKLNLCTGKVVFNASSISSFLELFPTFTF